MTLVLAARPRARLSGHVVRGAGGPVAGAWVAGYGETGEYFGLDGVGMEMWKVLRANGDVGAARAALLEQYDVAEDVLAKDLDELIAKLAERKLLVVADE